MRVEEIPVGTFFRSEEMALCQLFIPPEAAYSSVSRLGEEGIVQFRDLNPVVNACNRKFVNEVCRCDEMQRKLRYIESELTKDGVAIPELPNSTSPRAPNPREIIDLEARFEKTENEIMELSQNAVNMKSNFLELSELRQVLIKAQGFFDEHKQLLELNRMPELPESNADAQGRLGFVAGVIQRERVAGFERMLWRISRGNVFLRQAELEEGLECPVTNSVLHKTVFVAFFQSEQLLSRIKKVCTGYHASIYPCPMDYEERGEMLREVETRLADLQLVLSQTQDHRQRVLVSVAREMRIWTSMVFKMKAIYHTLNMFNMDVSHKCLIGECWVPVNDLPAVRKLLVEESDAIGSTINSFLNLIEYVEAAPTYNRTNKFTKCFQVLIDSYGVAANGELNPALYTIVTFPFLFSVMFGDLGHGIIITIFAAWMVLWEKSLEAKKSNNEIWNIFFGGRYIILMMGVFSCYTGFVYNDLFSTALNFFGSSWQPIERNLLMGTIELDPATDNLLNKTYFIGLDPIWHLATNKIQFFNSFKMKLSIILGVVHMIFGVCLSVVNMRHFRKSIDIWLQFVPQILFLVLLFGYLVFMMFFKWLMYGPKSTDISRGIHCAPSILITFINMMLFKKNVHSDQCKGDMFPHQQIVQRVFVLIALCCIPWMLLAKPFYEMRLRRIQASYVKSSIKGETNQGIELNESDAANHSKLEQQEPSESDLGSSDTLATDEEPISDVFIYQAIHTIEYALSTISHTASYLRLWALSLAHAQLSEVLWTMVMRKGLQLGSKLPLPINSLALVVVFMFWAILTLAILVLMEGLSAFLHTLRLHWVEFMSKFYSGSGYAFEPFSFRTIMEVDETRPKNDPKKEIV